MRISDWSSDVCSSDLPGKGIEPDAERHFLLGRDVDHRGLQLLDEVGKAFGGAGAGNSIGDLALLVLRDLRADGRLGDQRQRGATRQQGRSDAIKITPDRKSTSFLKKINNNGCVGMKR